MSQALADILRKLAENSPILAALFIVCGVAVAILYYLVQYHLPAQSAAFSAAIVAQRESFAEALKRHSEQTSAFIEYMRTSREAEAKSLTQVLDRMLAAQERQADDLAKEIKSMSNNFIRLRSTIHQHHDLMRARAAEYSVDPADAELEDRDIPEESGRRGARA